MSTRYRELNRHSCIVNALQDGSRPRTGGGRYEISPVLNSRDRDSSPRGSEEIIRISPEL
jgi:hypothetical protein